MSRDNLLNSTCEIYQVTTSVDAYNQPISTNILRSTQITRWRELKGRELLLLGLDISTKVVRFYLKYHVNIDVDNTIVCDDKIYQVKWINILGRQGGLVGGLQVDCYFTGTCSKLIDGITWGAEFASPETPYEWSYWYYKNSNTLATYDSIWGNLKLKTGDSFVSNVVNTGGWQSKSISISYDDYDTGSGIGTIWYRSANYNFDKADTNIVWLPYIGSINLPGQYVQLMVRA